MKKDFAIIGLGAFGHALCRELTERGANVIALDKDEERVSAAADYATYVYCCDCTRRSALEEIGIRDVDDVIVAIGDDLESLILTVILLKEIGVKRVIARSESESVKRVLLHLGVSEIVDARELAVNSLSYRLLSRSVTQYFEITKEHSVATIRYEGKETSKPIMQLNLREKFHLNILLIRRGGKDIVPTKDDCIEPGDNLVVFGSQSAIRKMDRKIKF